MRRVLRQTAEAVEPRVLVAPSAADDPAVRAVIDHEVAAAHERGLTAGLEQGRREAEQDIERVAGALHAAVAQARELSADIDAAIAARLTGLAVEIAAAVVGDLPPEQLNLVERVRDAIGAIDDRPLTVHASPADAPTLEGLADRDVEIVTAAGLQPGEARVTGRWADADLTWEAVWEAVREALDVA